MFSVGHQSQRKKETGFRSASAAANPHTARPVSTSALFTNPVQRKCACGGACAVCADSAADADQNPLTISSPGDRSEKEADRAAKQIMSAGNRVSITLSQPQTASDATGRIHAKAGAVPEKHAPSSDALPPVAAYVNSLDGCGQALSQPTREFFEHKMGNSFGAVRLHTDTAAQDAAASIHARAFTYGNHIVFNRNEYRPSSFAGMHLLAHELTHVAQQGASTLNRQIYRTGEDELTPQIVAEDPDLLVCFLLCELGIPPAIWRDITSLFLQAVWDEYSDRYSRAQASVNFRQFEQAFRLYSPLKIIQLILTFVVQGKIGLIPVRAAAASAARQALERRLLARGATTAGLAVAEQIARKIVIAIEIAIAAGCALYCGSLAYARTLIMLTQVLVEVLAAFVSGLEIAGELIGAIAGGIATELIVRPVFTALALMDVNNWRLSGMPDGTRADMLVVGLYLSSQITGDDFDALLTQLSRRIDTYPDSLSDLVFMIMTTVVEERVQLDEEHLPFTPRQLLHESPVQFFNLLYEEGYLDFEQSPESVVDAMIAGDTGAEVESDR
jgi:hypothetical protein